MPDVEQKTVDVDTSGPGAEVQIPEIDKPENEVTTEEVSNETVIENSTESNDSIEKPDEQSNVQAEEKTEQETEKKVEEENKKEIDDYSDGVKRRIAKLTKKMREAERREQAALEYAKTIKTEQDQLKSRYSKLDTGYVSEMENRIKSNQDNKPESVREPVKATEIRQQTVQQPINPDPRAQSWAQKNSWFGSEEAMDKFVLNQADKFRSKIFLDLEIPHLNKCKNSFLSFT